MVNTIFPVAIETKFTPRTQREGRLQHRLRELLEEHGEVLLGTEIIDNWGHITASVAIFNFDSTQVLRVWSAKEARWKRPGAHIEISPLQTAHEAAARALGHSNFEMSDTFWTLDEQIVEPYWNTPKHTHLELVFRAATPQNADLPRGARWFDVELDTEGACYNNRHEPITLGARISRRRARPLSPA